MLSPSILQQFSWARCIPCQAGCTSQKLGNKHSLYFPNIWQMKRKTALNFSCLGCKSSFPHTLMKPCWPLFAILGLKRVCCAGVTASHLAGLRELHFPSGAGSWASGTPLPIPLQGSAVTKTRNEECTRIQTFNLGFVSRWQSYLQWQNCRQVTITQREHLQQPP